LLRSGRNLRPDLIAGYRRELLDRPVAELAENTAAWLGAVRAAKAPYLFPQLAHPRRFARCLAATARWAGAYRSFAADLRLLGQRHTARKEP
jgi:hypothetical protein